MPNIQTTQHRSIHLASHNAGKLREFTELLAPLGYSLKAADADWHVTEDGTTFAANALKKAQGLLAQWPRHTAPPRACLADDSGLEVEALGNAPGVHSARYAKVTASATSREQDAANRRQLLEALRPLADLTKRRARLICVLAYIVPHTSERPERPEKPNTPEHLFRGVLNGHITLTERGQTGFGYDPLFVPDGATQTLAELGLEAKNKISHRAQALEQLLAHLHNFS